MYRRWVLGGSPSLTTLGLAPLFCGGGDGGGGGGGGAAAAAAARLVQVPCLAWLIRAGHLKFEVANPTLVTCPEPSSPPNPQHPQ
ncbi:predicted protein [Plenodomus lingam JN3]|uniref:Predicted protein n=1 Tax=Leptosphaeria maculans (strain JN3 / isolate v23.1.3 / race Av1-4-5-6-7-8) TaxID=985895 RepID=E5A822_LEPMJ|nr:predicted protein [Plenodomus lingam JN3]CBX99767.1 predicted protein [Plenodomus lingam JN3]